MNRTAILTFWLLACLPGWAAAENEEWWQQKSDTERALELNSGDLEFLPEPPEAPVHHHDNRITITEVSLDSGWIGLRQCHEHLDPVRRAQIVFGEGRIRGLRVTASRNIERAWVEGASVQLEGVRRDARLCIEAESRALHREGEAYLLQNGPYMRRYLDGYFPMHVTMTVETPAGLRVASVEPERQPGFRVWREEGRYHLDAWFEGRLVTRLRLVREP